MATATRRYIERTGFHPTDSGKIHLTGTATLWGPRRWKPDAVAFGPLTFRTDVDATAIIESIEFGTEQPSTIDRLLDSVEDTIESITEDLPELPLVAAGGLAVAAPERDDASTVSRREAIGVLVGATALTAVAEEAAASPAVEHDTLPFCELEVVQNPQGIHIGVDDMVEAVLPADHTYIVENNGQVVSRFSPADDQDGFLPPQRTGIVQIATSARPDAVEGVSRLFGTQTITYDFELDQPAAEYDEGTNVTVTDGDITEPLSAAADDGSASILTIGEVSIPHRQETAEPVGDYVHSEGDGLIYRPGPEAPDAAAGTLKVYPGGAAELLDDVTRRF